MRSMELTFDEATDAGIRRDWARLAEAGIRSLAAHTAPSNRPHLTLAAGLELDVVSDLSAAAVMSRLPLEVRFGGLLLFTSASGSFVLARSVVASAALLALHRAMHDAIEGAVPQTHPDAWSPHVTLARRVPAAHLGDACTLLEPAEPATAVAARWWDGETRTLTAIGPSESRPGSA